MLRSDAQRNRARLIRSTRDLIASVGSIDFSVRDVAGQAGVSTATVYRHFESKRDLIDQISVDRWRRAATWALGSGEPGQALVDIVSLLDRFSWMVTADAGFIWAAGLEVGKTPHAIRPARDVFSARFDELWMSARDARQVLPWVDPRDVMDLLGSIRDPARRISMLATLVSSFCAPQIDPQRLVLEVHEQRPIRIRL